jgi:hypothetical protein
MEMQQLAHRCREKVQELELLLQMPQHQQGQVREVLIALVLC